MRLQAKKASESEETADQRSQKDCSEEKTRKNGEQKSPNTRIIQLSSYQGDHVFGAKFKA